MGKTKDYTTTEEAKAGLLETLEILKDRIMKGEFDGEHDAIIVTWAKRDETAAENSADTEVGHFTFAKAASGIVSALAFIVNEKVYTLAAMTHLQRALKKEEK